MIVLRFPPPETCDRCARICEPFVSRGGWLCWACLPEEDRADADGNPLAEPQLDRDGRADLQLIRERLDPHAPLCDACRERRAPSELAYVEGRRVCGACRRLATRRSPTPSSRNKGVTSTPMDQNAPECTIVAGETPLPITEDSALVANSEESR